MNWKQKIRSFMSSFLAGEQISVPVDGRSSIEKTGLNYSLTNFADRYQGVSPIISFEMLKVLKQLWLYHPEFSQHVSNLVNLSNTGHRIVVSAATAQLAEAALNRLNETAGRIYKHGAGIDGLINQELTSLQWSGAISSEDVVNITARRVEKVAIVPVEDIRFRYEDDDWRPFQYVGIGRGQAKDGLIRLHPETYRYYAMETIDNSPYAKPPATAAVEAITGLQNEVIDNVKYIVRKFSILGLLSVMVRRLAKKNNETDAEFDSRSKKYLKDVKDSLSGSFNRGLLVAYDNMQFKGESVTGNGTGFYDIYRVVGETVFSALGQQPAFFGRTDSTTETYADVVYQLLLARGSNSQRLVKRRRERTYMFDLRLGGLNVDGVSIKFNKSFSRNALAETQAEETRVRTVLEKGRAGIISPDMAAQELGYESAFDADLLIENPSLAATLNTLGKADRSEKARSFQFAFDKNSQKYRFVDSGFNVLSLSNVETSADEKKKA